MSPLAANAQVAGQLGAVAPMCPHVSRIAASAAFAAWSRRLFLLLHGATTAGLVLLSNRRKTRLSHLRITRGVACPAFTSAARLANGRASCAGQDLSRSRPILAGVGRFVLNSAGARRPQRIVECRTFVPLAADGLRRPREV